MRGVRFSVVAVALLLSALVVNAQNSSRDKFALPASAIEPLEREKASLTVWFVEPATPLEKAQIALRRDAPKKMLPTTVQESTMADFGQTASSVGQTAGSYGVSPSNVGTNASNTGRPASEHGTNAGNFGRNASQTGTNASNAGQTAGSFGQSASNVGTSAGNYSSATNTNWGGEKQQTQSDREEHWTCGKRNDLAQARVMEWPDTGREICGRFQGMQLRVEIVPEEDVLDRLKRVEGTESYPDVVFGTERLPWWNKSGYGVDMLGWPVVWPPKMHLGYGRDQNVLHLGAPTVMRRASHPLEARAFVVWLRDEDMTPPVNSDDMDANTKKAAQTATDALGSMLNGGGLEGLADEHAAKFDEYWARFDALEPQQSLPGKLQTRVDVMTARAGRRLAVVSLRGIVWSDEAFGVVHALAYLRKNAAGDWKVLQLSPNLWPGELRSKAGSLHYDSPHSADVPPVVNAVLPATPIDNDVRPVGTELWWENDGSAMLQVVEWEFGNNDRWSEPHIFPVRDQNPHTQTRVAPDFTRVSGTYRWRVWSVGQAGGMAFTPWRGLTITP